jgi:hypothetical protein
MQYRFHVLTPAYGLGSYGRTGISLLVGGSRNRIGSQKRIYSYYKDRGQGQLYLQFLLNAIYGPPQAVDALTLFDPTGGGGQLNTNPGDFIQGTLASNFYLASGYNYFNFAIYGGGGDGAEAGSGPDGTGGGGAGAFIGAIAVPYSPSSGVYITNITYGVSGGGQYKYNSYVIVNYNNSTSINLQAGQGNTTVDNQGTVGSTGGKASYSNNTIFYDSSNIITVDGTNGGNQGNNGTSNGYTSSGSGNNGGATAPIGNPPTALNIFGPITVTSAGGGKSQLVSGYGAGGAATPANYNNNASKYRTSTQGTIIYWLSTSPDFITPL